MPWIKIDRETQRGNLIMGNKRNSMAKRATITGIAVAIVISFVTCLSLGRYHIPVWQAAKIVLN